MAVLDPAAHPLDWRNLMTPAGLGLTALALKLSWAPLQLSLALPEDSLADRIGDNIPTLIAAAAAALLSIRIIQFFTARHMGAPPPKLMRQIIALMVWAVTGGILAGVIFRVPLGSLVTTSGMMVAVIGIALKNMISDLATGLSLPVKVGDWIEVDGNLGRVVEVSWRATRLLTRADIMVIIPNTHLMSKPFRNFSQPEDYFRDSFIVTLPSSVSVEQAERILLGSARQVEEVAALPVTPKTRIAKFGDNGIDWELRYYVPDAHNMSRVRYQVQRNLLHNLRHAGITLPMAQIELHPVAALPPRDNCDADFLRGIEMFAGLSEDELTQLSGELSRQLIPAGKSVVHQGQPGESLFILKEGLLAVSIAGDGDLDTVVGQIVPGQFFGEMSLLTGAPRSATVRATVNSLVFEVARPALAPLLRSRPALVSHLSEMLAARQLRNAPKLEAARQNGDDRKQSLTKQLMGKINAFFRLGPEDGA